MMKCRWHSQFRTIKKVKNTLVYYVRIDAGEGIEDSLIFKFEDVNEMNEFLRLYYKSRNEICDVSINVEEL